MMKRMDHDGLSVLVARLVASAGAGDGATLGGFIGLVDLMLGLVERGERPRGCQLERFKRVGLFQSRLSFQKD